jgi:hypothetical protein|tara:strand:+ start:458 stop:631 length:174 start_codon:yes stop_codon:yes gene_type:complete
MTLTTKQLEHFYKVYELNPMSTIMTSLMGMTNNDFNKSIELMEQIEDYITKKELNEI